MHAIILSIGDELVSGLTTNTNSAWLAQQLLAIGIPSISHVTVGDRLQSIIAAIRAACEQLELEPSTGSTSGVLLITGGLGPTEDDLTRQALAEALMQPLVEDPDAMLQIENWFKSRGRAMSPSNRLQALRPQTATIIENTAGTAPGLRATHQNTEIFVTPGVPGEMREMYNNAILPAVRKIVAARSPDPKVTVVTKINTFGLGESVLGEKIKDLMVRKEFRVSSFKFQSGRLENGFSTVETSVGTTVHDGIVSVRIYATGTRAQVGTATGQIREDVQERLGAFIFSEGETALEAVVAKLLLDSRQTIATAESCTGGLLAKLLTDTPGSSAYFQRGWVTYANIAKHEELAISEELIAEHGAVSEAVARAMAEGARRFAESDFAVGITGVAGPDGGTAEKPVGTVWIALATPDGTEVRRFIMPGHRGAVRMRAAQMALAMLRWRMMGIVPPI